MTFQSASSLFKKLRYKRFFGPQLASCLDKKSSPPNALIFVRDESRIPNLEWDFAILYEITELEHLDKGFCQIISKARLFKLESSKAKLLQTIDNQSKFQLFIITECFLCPEELLRLNEINFN